MALSATVYQFTVALSDVDRGVYQTLSVKAARHPSESAEYLWTRVLAYCLEYREGIAFSRGLSEPDEPAVVVRDLTGTLQAWIEVGVPDAARLHKAAKAAPRVAVYMHKDPAPVLRALAEEKVHRAGEIEVCAFERDLIAALVRRLERRVDLALSVTDRHAFLSLEGETLEADLQRRLP